MSGADPRPAVARFDLRGESIVLPDGRWTPHMTRDPRTMRGVVIHSWGVDVSTEPRLRMQHGGEAQALARRALRAPYNVCGGVGLITGEAVCVVAHPVERYTYASDAACRDFVSVGIFGRFAYNEADHDPRFHTEVTPALIAAVSDALDEAVSMLPPEDGPFLLITHRQSVNGQNDHDACPGEAVVRMALMSRAVKSGLLVPDVDLVLVPEHGHDWPPHWRKHVGCGSTSKPVAPVVLPPPPIVTSVPTVDDKPAPRRS